MPKYADTDKQKISQYWWLPISEPIIGATLIALPSLLHVARPIWHKVDYYH